MLYRTRSQDLARAKVKSFSEITDEEWSRVAALLSELPASKKGKRPQRLDRRGAFNGVLWVLQTGSPWNAMPTRFPFHDTCRRCFWAWADSGVMEGAVDALATPAAQELRALIGQRLAARRQREQDRFNRLHSRDGKLVWFLRCLMEAREVIRDPYAG
jgi:transposase